MNQKPVINTKSIPSFTILLPVISLVSVTLFVLVMIHGIKNDLMQSDAKEQQIQQEKFVRNEIKNLVNQAVSQTKAILKLQVTEHKSHLKFELDNFILHLKHPYVNTIDNKQQTIQGDLNTFNESHPFFKLKILTLPEVKKVLSAKEFQHYQKKLFVYTSPIGPSKDKSSLKYLKKFKQWHLIITLNRKNFLQKHAQSIAQTLDKINNYDQGSFHIHAIQKDKSAKLLYKNSQSYPHKILKDQNFIDEITSQKKGAYREITLDNKEGIIYAKHCSILDWIISIQLAKESIHATSDTKPNSKALYFEKKTEELLIVIIIVASIVLLLSLIVAKIINTIFTKFKKQIEDQNTTLVNFNKELSHKITEQTTELQESEARYRTIFERSRDGVLILEDERISYCNESTLKMFGIHLKASLIGMPISKLFPKYQPDGNESAKLLHDYLDITAALGHSRFEVLLEKANKQTFYVDVWLQNIELEDQQTIHVVFRDIDFQKNAQEKIKEQHKELLVLNETLEEKVKYEVLKNQEKEQLLVHQSRLAQMGEMISMIAHQWRQPLSAISTSSANMKLLIELDQYNQDTFCRNLDNIDDYIQHLSETINDFRNFFKPDKQTERTTLGEVVNKSLNIIAQSLEGHEISVSQSIDNEVELLTYPYELMQVLLNILKNAEDILLERDIKNKHITISYRKVDRRHELSFSDNAGGIPKDIIDKIFDPYFSTKHQKNGTGLGLYMSRVIISEHCRGSLSAHNEEDGAVFVISLPDN